MKHPFSVSIVELTIRLPSVLKKCTSKVLFSRPSNCPTIAISAILCDEENSFGGKHGVMLFAVPLKVRNNGKTSTTLPDHHFMCNRIIKALDWEYVRSIQRSAE